jgi:DMSO/TMAO reductase YedYZ heme-binding membrane subunit
MKVYSLKEFVDGEIELESSLGIYCFLYSCVHNITYICAG